MGEPTEAEVEHACEVVRRWVRRRFYSENREDLEQEGCMGVLEARSSFDPGRGVQFLTYAFRGAQFRVYGALEKDLTFWTNSTHREVREARNGQRAHTWSVSLEADNPDRDSPCAFIAAEADEPEPELWDDDAIRAFVDSLGLLAERLSTERLRSAAEELARRPTASLRDVGEAVGLSQQRVHHVRNRAIQMTRNRIGVDAWMPRRKMVAVP